MMDSNTIKEKNGKTPGNIISFNIAVFFMPEI